MRRRRREQREERRRHVAVYRQQKRDCEAAEAAVEEQKARMERKKVQAEADTWRAREAKERRMHAGRAVATATRCAMRAAARKHAMRSREQAISTDMPQSTQASGSGTDSATIAVPVLEDDAATDANMTDARVHDGKRVRTTCEAHEHAKNISFIVAMHFHAVVV